MTGPGTSSQIKCTNTQFPDKVSFLSLSVQKLTQLPLFNAFLVSDLLKRIEQKQAMCPHYGIGAQAFSVTSPETTVKKDKGTVGILIVYSD